MVYFKILILLYADDTILLSESRDYLQIVLNNVQKTKILIFSKGRIPKNLKFHIDNNEIEIVKDYKYLGIVFCKKWILFNHKKIPTR